jgi:hypothetical protein
MYVLNLRRRHHQIMSCSSSVTQVIAIIVIMTIIIVVINVSHYHRHDINRNILIIRNVTTIIIRIHHQ